MIDLTDQLSTIVPTLKTDEPLKNHTTYRIGGPARYLADVSTVKDLRDLWLLTQRIQLPVAVLGAGSNVLVSDAGFPGLVLRLTGEFKEFTLQGNVIKAGAGVRLPLLVREAMESELSGLECLAGVPGTVGGALITNAGTRNEWIGDSVVEVATLSDTGETVVLDRNQLKFSYRNSNLENRLILGATLHLKKRQKNDIFNEINKLTRSRSQAQPVGAWSAGSVFKNPPDASAGKLIESARLKGAFAGGAQISEKHANFIINTGAATAADVKALISLAREKVAAKFGVNLELEIKIIGE